MLRNVDPEMAILRSITAEEEAATALFLSLKRRRYDGADRLNHRSHVHKNGVIPLLEAIARALEPFADYLPPTQLFFDDSTKPCRLLLGFHLIDPSTGEEDWAYPQPPFDFFNLRQGEVGKGEWPHDFSRELSEIASEANATSALAFVEERANLRNRILYASTAGIPCVGGDIDASLSSSRF